MRKDHARATDTIEGLRKEVDILTQALRVIGDALGAPAATRDGNAASARVPLRVLAECDQFRRGQSFRRGVFVSAHLLAFVGDRPTTFVVGLLRRSVEKLRRLPSTQNRVKPVHFL